MTKEMIGAAIDPQYHNMYTPTSEATRLTFHDGSFIVGTFLPTDRSVELEKENKYLFIEHRHKMEHDRTKNDALLTVVEGDLLADVEYPSFPR